MATRAERTQDGWSTERDQDVHLQRTGGRPRRRLRRDRCRQGLSTAASRPSWSRRGAPGLQPRGRPSRRWDCAPRRSASWSSRMLRLAERGGARWRRRRRGRLHDRDGLGAHAALRRARRDRWSACSRTPVAYARTRPQFGQAIGKFQAVSHRIADMKVQLEAARLLIYRAAWRLGGSRSVVAGRLARQALRQRVAGRGGPRCGPDPRRDTAS